MDWSKGYTAIYEATVIDTKTWTDTMNRFEFSSGSINKDTTTTLMESANISLSKLHWDIEAWIRIYLKTVQEGGGTRVPLFTGLTSTPARNVDGRRVSWDVECYSVLKPANDVYVPLGYSVDPGSGAELVKSLLSVGPAPVVIDGDSPGTSETIVASDTDTNLSVSLAILNSIDWRIRISGDGTITLCPKSTVDDSLITFNPTNNDSIELNVTDTEDWFACPNVLRVVSDSKAVIVRDDDPDSRLSTWSRGREVWVTESNPELTDEDTLNSYAVKRLRELQSPTRKESYTRRYYDDITVGDTISLDYRMIDLVGTFLIKSQSITLGYNCKMSEEVETHSPEEENTNG